MMEIVVAGVFLSWLPMSQFAYACWLCSRNAKGKLAGAILMVQIVGYVASPVVGPFVIAVFSSSHDNMFLAFDLIFPTLALVIILFLSTLPTMVIGALAILE